MRLELETRLPSGPSAEQSANGALRAALELHLRRIAEVVNANDGSPMIEESASLPTAGEDYHGRLLMLKRDGAANDTLHWCRQDTGGAYSWVLVA